MKRIWLLKVWSGDDLLDAFPCATAKAAIQCIKDHAEDYSLPGVIPPIKWGNVTNYHVEAKTRNYTYMASPAEIYKDEGE